MATPAQTEHTAEPRCWPAAMRTVEENLGHARRAVNTARHAAEDAVGEAVVTIRRHPVRFTGAAAVVGAAVGALAGFGAGWFVRNRR